MRTVTGRSDRVVVVGAGLGGLSAALHLAGAGREVTVLEREPAPGGLAGSVERAGYRFDAGPSVLTMPDVLAETFAAVGESLDDHLDLVALRPAYRARFADGSALDVHPDVAATADGIARLAGPAEAAGYRRFVRLAGRLYRLQRDRFIGRNLDGVAGTVGPELAALVALGGLRRLDRLVGRYLRDPRVRRVFTFQALYAGVSPFEALGLYAVIPYLDTVGGVFFPRGGMHAVPLALAGAARRHGVELRLGTTVTAVELAGDRAVAVRTADGERVAADVVVLNPDLPTAYRDLLPPRATPRRVRRLRPSPSCFLLLLGARAGYPATAHHTLSFGAAWRTSFRELVDDAALMSDPSMLVTNATRTDPALAPAGGHTYAVVVPVPHLGSGLDWRALGPRYREEVLAWLDRRDWPGLAGAVQTEVSITPAGWAAAGRYAGTPFSAAHTLGQTGPFRPANLAPGLANVVFAGSGTHPGVGVPMVLLSGRLAAERVTGARR